MASISITPTGTNPKTYTTEALESQINAALVELEGLIGEGVSGLTYAGSWDASGGAFPSGTTAGDFYTVGTAGTVNSVAFAKGDWLISLVDSASTSTYTANWAKVEYSDTYPIVYNTVADLLASTEVSRTVGAVWEVRGVNGRHFYQEVASGENLTTAGAVDLKVMPVLHFMDTRAFGATSESTAAANTAACQAAINAAATSGVVEVLLPLGVINIENLLGHYDVTDNAGFPNGTSAAGNITLRGYGMTSRAAYTNGHRRGTILVSSTSTQPAVIYALSAKQFRVEDVTIIANTTVPAIMLEDCNQYSGMSRIFVAQSGSGGGIEVKDVYNHNSNNIFVQEEGGGAGNGFYLYNENTSGAGFVKLDTINVNGFNNAVVIGHLTRTSAARLHGVHCVNVQGGEAASYGFTIGGGIANSTFQIHCEDNATGLRIINNPRKIDIEMTTSSNMKDVEVGSATAAENYYRSVRLSGDFICDGADIIEVFNGANTQGLQIVDSTFDGDSTNNAITLASGLHTRLTIGNNLYANIGTEIINPEGVSFLHDTQSLQWRTGNSGGTLSKSPFRFRQDSTTGSQAVVEFFQRDQDIPFFEIATSLTAGGGLSHITTGTGTGSVAGPGGTDWTIERMVMVRVTDGAGTTDYWLPLYSAV